jgi:hypothetical protein
MLFTLTKPITGHNSPPNNVTAHYSTEPTTKLASFIKRYTIYEPVFYSVSRVFFNTVQVKHVDLKMYKKEITEDKNCFQNVKLNFY